jgi:VanZ family protein
VVVWAGVIFTFSTDAFSSEHTQSVVLGILHTLLPHARQHTLSLAHDFIRKCAHLGEYFIFGVLLFRAMREPRQRWQWRWAFLAILIAALYASSDEIHQIFVPSRGASVWDALLDTCGACVAQLAVWMVNRREQPSREQGFGSSIPPGSLR